MKQLRYWVVIAVTLFGTWTFLGFEWGWWEGLTAALASAFIIWLVPFVGRVGRRQFEHWRRDRRDLRAKLDPQPKVTLLEADEIQPRALAQYVESLSRINEAVTSYSQRLTLLCAEHVADKRQAQSSMARHVSAFAAYRRGMKNELQKLRSSRRQLTDAWSSRMYWHDHRATASDIIKSEKVVTGDMLQIVSGVTDKYKENRETFRIAFAGRTPEMERVYKDYDKVIHELIDETVEWEWFCASVLDFKRKRSGIRGILRSSFRRLR